MQSENTINKDVEGQTNKPATESQNQYRSSSQLEKNANIKFQKRRGTSGLSGQLYETKLLSLILLRALYDDNIKQFALGTNIEGVGAFDDIFMRYQTNDSQKTKFIFLQAKHRDITDKNKLTVGDLFKQEGDFSLQKYLESYLEIQQKFITDGDNGMFMDSTNDTGCEFIIYTSLEENFAKKKILDYFDEDSLIKTSQHGKIFQFTYESQDVEDLVSTITRSRAILLAKTFSKFIIRDNFRNIMLSNLMKMYHVFLAQKVITLESATKDTVTESNDENNSVNPYCIGKFRESFWTSDDSHLMLMRHVICNEIAEMKGMISTHQLNEVESITKSLSFKLPVDFGNHYYRFNGSEKKQQRKLDYLCSIFHKLLHNNNCKDSKYIVVKLDDNSVGPGGIIQRKDLENYRLAGLVGNLLINDEETKMLKFNFNERSLSKDNMKILHCLNNHFDLSLFRFDINIHSFPKLTLNCKERDRELVRDFLNLLKFYTNQAKEDEVENIIKEEIDKFSNVQHKHHDSLFRVKCDAIFLKVHDKIQKWWKQPNATPYLTKNCKFYQQAEREILDSPLMNIIHFTYSEKVKNSLVEFDYEAINSLQLDWFLNSNERVILLVSDEINFSSKKVFQYFNEIKERIDYTFIDLDFVIIENCFDIVMLELECSIIAVLVVICRGSTDTNNLSQKIKNVVEVFKGKIIILTHNSFEDDLKKTYSENIIHKDNKNSFSNLSSKVRRLILEERNVIFQGMEITVNSVLDDASLELLSSNLLSKIIYNKKIIIGETFTNAVNDKTINYYLKRSVCRYIKLSYERYLEFNRNIDESDKLCFITDASNINSVPQGKNDIVFLKKPKDSKLKNIFIETCAKNNESNIHLFIKSKDDHNNYIWEQSRGSLRAIIKFIDRGSHEDFILQLNSLEDIRDKVIIISAEPGMGKSTLLTQLARNTRRLHPSLWIIKINLLDNIDQFSEWQKDKTNINLKEVISYLFSIIDTKHYKNNVIYREKVFKLITMSNNNEVHLSDYDDKYLPGVDLSEIKLLNYFYNTGNLAVLLDGFDEVCPDYANEVIQLLCTLKTSRVAHLWVTSRPYNVLGQLEAALGTFSFSLKPLNKTEQNLLLQNIWSNQLALDEHTETIKSANHVENFYNVIAILLNDNEGKFLSLPLHLYMIAEIYQSFYKDYIKFAVGSLSYEYNMKNIIDTSNLITLYEKFTNMKFFKIRFGEKKHSMSFKDPDMRKIIEKERKVFIENHKKIAAYLLLDKSIVFSDHDIKDVHEFIVNVKSGEEKTGIIECIVGDDPKFVHFTFAEYFAVEFIFDKLKSANCTSSIWQYFIDHILSSNKQGIRRFINSKLQRDQKITIDLKSNEIHMNTVFDVLVAQNISTPDTAIYVAVQENLECIALLLLQCTKTILSVGNIDNFIKLITNDIFCTFCYAVIKRRKSTVEFILKLIEDIDRNKLKELVYRPNSMAFGPLLFALYDEQMTHIILNSLQHDPELIVQLFTSMPRHDPSVYYDPATIAHFLGKNVFAFRYCRDHLLNLKKEHRIRIFSLKDCEGKLPAHCAANGNDYDFFTEMHQLVGISEFKKICTTTDNSGFTPICRFPYDKMYFDKLKNILEIVHEESDIDVEDFVFNKLPKLYPKTLGSLIRYAPSSFLIHEEANVEVPEGFAQYKDETMNKVRQRFVHSNVRSTQMKHPQGSFQ